MTEVSSRNGCVNKKRATRNKAKKLVTKDGVLHYIAKEWMHNYIVIIALYSHKKLL